MSTTITYEGTMPGSRIQGELIERHADGSLTVVHPDGAPWQYRVSAERVISTDERPESVAAYTVRAMSDGQLLQDDVTFDEDQEHTASARFDSTVSYYTRMGLAHEVTVQMFDGSGDVLAEVLVEAAPAERTVQINISDNTGYSAEQVGTHITLADVLESIQEAIEEFGEDAKVVLHNGQRYGASYGAFTRGYGNSLEIIDVEEAGR